MNPLVLFLFMFLAKNAVQRFSPRTRSSLLVLSFYFTIQRLLPCLLRIALIVFGATKNDFALRLSGQPGPPGDRPILFVLSSTVFSVKSLKKLAADT